MRAQDVDGADGIELSHHVVVGHLAGPRHRSGDSTSDESEPETPDLHNFPIDELHGRWQRLPEEGRIVDVAVGAVTDGGGKGLTAPLVLRHDRLIDGGPDRIAPLPDDLGPGPAHCGIVAGRPMPGDCDPEFVTEDIDDDPFAGPVVEQVDEVAKNEEGLAPFGYLSKGVEGAVDVRDDEELQL